MERPAPAPPQARDIVFCHQCENEWYRDEHGMTPCPQCGGEFTEVIEDGSDPRDAAPDPDEEDIDHFEWRNNDAGNGRQFHQSFTRNININTNTLGGMPQGQQNGGLAGGLLGLLGGAIQTALGGAQQAHTQQQQNPQQGQNEEARAAPGAPPGQQPGTFVRHSEGPGYSYTIRSNISLFPRDANAAQPPQHQPDDIDRLMANMLANIGARPGAPGHFQFGPPQFGDDDARFPGGPAGGPFGNIFRMLGMPVGGVHGDAVYSQEALDRIVTQLMEQNVTGNAPGPASAQAIDSLPKKTISESDMSEEGKAECTICMDDVPIGGEVTVLPCGHWFHFECIKMWLAEHDTCPHCRQGIMPRDQATNSTARASNQAPLNNMHSSEYRGQPVPGGFPYPPGNATGVSASAEGSQQNPIPIPESPQQERQSNSGSMFSRMRETFGGGGSSGGSSDQGRTR